MGDGYHFRAAGFGGAVVVLTLLGVLLAGRRFAVPYFAGLTAVALLLTLDTTLLHRVIYLIPRYRELHEHDPWRALALASIGPAMLSGAGVEMAGRLRGRYRVLPIAMAPLVLVAGSTIAVGGIDGVTGWAPLAGATAVIAIALLVIDLPPDDALRPRMRWLPPAILALTSVVVFMQLTGLELTGSWLGWPSDARWEERWEPDPAYERALETQVRTSDPDGAGAYLQSQMDASGPLRYLGYGGVGHPDGGEHARSYMDRRFDTPVLGILVNGRPMFLGLYEVQGYDPIQMERYVDLVQAINGKGQDYHTAFVSDEGVDSPLLDLLDVQCVVVDASLPLDRADVVTLTEGFEEVFRSDRVVVYEHPTDLPHAWIVHEVRRTEPGEALPLIVDGQVDPYQTALIEGPVPAVERVDTPESDQATIRHYGGAAITIEAETAAPGFLVVSEMYADGWRAWVDGEPVEIIPAHHALRGVPVPAGDVTVEMRYEPSALRAGLWISGGATALIMGTLVVVWSRLVHVGRSRG